MEDTNSIYDLHTLIPLDDFKALMGVDDREDKTARFCLVTSTLSIEQYCKRKFLLKKYTENFQVSSDLLLRLREFPVNEIFSVNGDQPSINNSKLIDPIFYRPMIGNGYNEEMPFELLLSRSLLPYRLREIRVVYWAGFQMRNEKLGMRNEQRAKRNEKLEMRNEQRAKRNEKLEMRNVENGLYVPADLAAACLELAAWNMNRYRSRQIGMARNVRKDGELFEMSMPSNVRGLLEPYKRKVI